MAIWQFVLDLVPASAANVAGVAAARMSREQLDAIIGGGDNMSRCDGKPFLRLMDCYVLSSISHLNESQECALNIMAPKVAGALGLSGSWFQMVSEQMEFPPHMPDKIKEIWDAGKAKAEALGLSVDPNEFTRQFVDTNFTIP